MDVSKKIAAHIDSYTDWQGDMLKELVDKVVSRFERIERRVDGAMRYRYNGNQPVYAPNSYGGPKADPEHFADPSWSTSGEIMRSAYTPHAEDSDFVQAGNLYRHALSATDREHLVSNIVGHMSQGVERAVQERTLKLWYQVDRDLGTRIASGLGVQVQDAPALSGSAD